MGFNLGEFLNLNNKQKQQTPQPASTAQPSIAHRLDRAVSTVGAGALRSATGLGQGLSGLYDLATPGTGTNRLSQGLNNYAKSIDQYSKDQHYNQNAIRLAKVYQMLPHS
jgi:hypothetical protein